MRHESILRREAKIEELKNKLFDLKHTFQHLHAEHNAKDSEISLMELVGCEIEIDKTESAINSAELELTGWIEEGLPNYLKYC